MTALSRENHHWKPPMQATHNIKLHCLVECFAPLRQITVIKEKVTGLMGWPYNHLRVPFRGWPFCKRRIFEEHFRCDGKLWTEKDAVSYCQSSETCSRALLSPLAIATALVPRLSLNRWRRWAMENSQRLKYALLNCLINCFNFSSSTDPHLRKTRGRNSDHHCPKVTR